MATTAALLQQDGTLQAPPSDIVTSANLTAAYGEAILTITDIAPDGATISSCVPLL